jgi:hypothetical protein
VSLQASHGLQTRSAKRHEPHLSHNLPLLEENSGKKHPHIIAAEIDRACSEVPQKVPILSQCGNVNLLLSSRLKQVRTHLF